MKKLLSTLTATACVLAFSSTLGAAHAADNPQRQQQKTKPCTTNAATKKGDEHKAHTSNCPKK
ncbi:MAG: PsiF family protein [Comamonas sp.]